jgi:hypothetical protein
MERAEKTAALEQRASWTKKHWTPFFSDMPHRITSLGSLRNPFAIIARPAENSATFSALDTATTNQLPSHEHGQELSFTIRKLSTSAVLEEL